MGGVNARRTPPQSCSSASSGAATAPLPTSSKTRAEQGGTEKAQLDDDDNCDGHDDGDDAGLAADCGSDADRQDAVVCNRLSNNGSRSFDNTGDDHLLEKDRVQQLVAEETSGSCAGGSGSEASAKESSPRGGGGGSCGGGGGGDHAVMDAIGNLLLMIPVDVEKLRNMAWENGGYQVCRV